MNGYIPASKLWLAPLPPNPSRLPLTAGLPLNASSPARPAIDPALPVDVWARTLLNFDADPVQAEILNTATHRLILCCTRQWGKSSVAAIKSLHFAWSKPGALILFAAASLHQSAELLRKFRAFAFLLTGRNCQGDGTHLCSTVLPNGSRILALPQAPATVRGYSAPDLIVIDEAAFVSDEMHNALSPMLAASGGQKWLLSSPNAQSGEFYKIWHSDFPDWRKFSVTADNCPRIHPDFLASERRSKGDTVFRREYMCEFVAGPQQAIARNIIDNAFRGTYPASRLPE